MQKLEDDITPEEAEALLPDPNQTGLDLPATGSETVELPRDPTPQEQAAMDQAAFDDADGENFHAANE